LNRRCSTDKDFVAAVTLTQRNLREKAFQALNQLPPFNPTLNKLMATLAKEDVFFSEVASVIERDTVLAGNVLKLVNSALYARSGTVNSVRNAVVILGLNKLRNLALSLSVTRMFKQMHGSRSWSQAAFNLHSVAAAIMADELAQHVTVNYPEGAFTAGLLHAVGKLLIAVGIPEQFEEILILYQNSGNLTMEAAEEQIIGCRHVDLASRALAYWNLPADIQSAVARQCRPPGASATKWELGSLLFVAHHVINRLDAMIRPCASLTEGSAERVLAQYGLGARSARIIADYKAEFETMRSFF
jgi:HD-like signal output (HDOD) protein